MDGKVVDGELLQQALALRVLWLCHPPSSDHLTTSKLRRDFAPLCSSIATRSSFLLENIQPALILT